MTPIMLTETIEVPGQGTADRLQLIESKYEFDLASGKERIFCTWCLASATQTFYGPGTVTQQSFTGDMVQFAITYPDAAADLMAAQQPTLAASYWLAKKLALKLANGTRINVV